jgi:hypothetical protein
MVSTEIEQQRDMVLSANGLYSPLDIYLVVRTLCIQMLDLHMSAYYYGPHPHRSEKKVLLPREKDALIRSYSSPHPDSMPSVSVSLFSYRSCYQMFPTAFIAAFIFPPFISFLLRIHVATGRPASL